MARNIHHRSLPSSQSGQTLIALLIFMLLAITITTTAAAITIINTQSNGGYVNGETALGNATTGVENALIQLERNPSYAGETLTLANGSAVVTVTGTSTKTIVSVGSIGNYDRTVTATASYSGNVFSLTSWNETP